MTMLARYAGVASGLLATAAVGAPIPLTAICDVADGIYTVNPVKLQQFALHGVDISLLDIESTGSVPADAMINALTDEDYCIRDPKTQKVKPPVLRSAAQVECQSTRQSLVSARGIIAGFERSHPDVTFQQIRRPTTTETALRPGMIAVAYGTLLDEKRRFVRMVCGDGSPPGPTEAGGGKSKAGPVPPARDSLKVGKFLLTKDIESLSLPRATEAQLKNIPQAEISYVDDRAKRTDTFSIDATAGFVLTSGSVALIPFAQYVRSRVDDRVGSSDSETSRLALGIVGSVYFGQYDIVDVAPLYVRDFEAHSEIIGGRVTWRPGLLYRLPSFGRAYQFLCTETKVDGGCLLGGNLMAVRTDLQLITSFGHVIHAGSAPDLNTGGGYLRVGPSVHLTVYGLKGVVDDLALDFAYRRLFRITGDRPRVSALSAGIAYWVAGSRHVSLRYGYDRGRDEETLEKFEKWSLAVGVRF